MRPQRCDAGALFGSDSACAYAAGRVRRSEIAPARGAALAEPDPGTLLDCFACIAGEFLQRAAMIQYVLASAAAVDTHAAEILAITRQRLTGQSRIVPALVARDALAEGLSAAKAADIAYTLLSAGVYWIRGISCAPIADKQLVQRRAGGRVKLSRRKRRVDASLVLPGGQSRGTQPCPSASSR